MNEQLYEMMDWARIEGLVYSEEDQPHDFLGAHVVPEGILVQAFIPTAKEVSVKTSDSITPMDLEDETGFFAALLPGKKVPSYKLVITYDDGSRMEVEDAYAFEPTLTKKDTDRFNAGICYDIYEKLGAHPRTVNGVKGVAFAVWAPNAVRVSVVGDFDLWDGRRLPMRRLWGSGVFELFVPGLKEGMIYKYEVKARGGLTFLKADPYANAAQLRPDTASVIADLSGYYWTDDDWLSRRAAEDTKTAPMSIYEVHLGSWKKPDDGREFYNYTELAPMIAEYVKKMGYTHIELMPVMEHPLDASWGYQTSGYYAPTARYGTPRDFMFFMNYMHQEGIGVILDWAPAQFPRDNFCLGGFDGTCLYEHKDPRKGISPAGDTYLYNYGRPEVKNFLIGSALFWKNVYHADGIRMACVSSMLYLDYGRAGGDWVANMYGGNENLEAIEFIKHLNSIWKKQEDGAVLIAQEDAAWPRVTGALDEDGLGFDYKWNTGWTNDFLSYIQLDPIFRGPHHGELIFSMIYNYSENFILSLSHDEVVRGKGSMISKMPGRKENKYANLRVAYGYFMTHPGKKLLFMGQDLAQPDEWTETRSVDWSLTENEAHKNMQHYMRQLLKVYTDNPALWALDYSSDGFEWINNISANENMLVFLRRSDREEETLLVVVNFSNVVYTEHKIGLPFEGRYKEIFNSDRKEFGGQGNTNPRVKHSKKDECDGRPDSVRITVPPLGISIFSCERVQKVLSGNEKAKAVKKETRKQGETAAKKTAAGPDGKKALSLKEQLQKKIEEEGE